jgi:lysophospholipase L1-like esterase
MYSEPFMQKLNLYYTKRYNGRLFFNFQWFCKIGTKYSDYNDLAELDEQLASSKFDLVIISLGTNDAFSGSARVNFYEKIDHLVKKIKTFLPDATLLITTPPDALKYDPVQRGYMALPDLVGVVNTIITYCTNNKIAFWNLHQIMGGTYSINRWIAQKMAGPDHVHFNAKGYGQFADWLFQAFTKNIN